MKKGIFKIAYFCVLVLMILEFVINCYPFNFNEIAPLELFKNGLNCVVMGIIFCAIVAMIEVFVKGKKYEYIDLLGVSIIMLLYSDLLLSDAIKGIDNLKLLAMIRLIVYQLGSVIKIFIPIMILLSYERNHSKDNLNFYDKYKKPIGYIGLCLTVAILQNNLKLTISVITINLICSILLSAINSKKICN